MSNDKRQQDFAQRLARISQDRGLPGQPEVPDMADTTRGPTRPPFDHSPPQNDYRLRNSLIWATIFGLMGAGAYLGWTAIPADTRDALTGLVLPDGTEVTLLSSQSPDGHARNTRYGPVYDIQTIAQDGAADLQLTDVFSSVALPDDTTGIGPITPIVQNVQCRLRPIGRSEKPMGVRLDKGAMQGPVTAYSDQRLADTLLLAVQGTLEQGDNFHAVDTTMGQTTVADVVITDQSGPIYLILQNQTDGMIWNLHPAPGVEIAHVAVISGGYAGVANLPMGTTIEAIYTPQYASNDNCAVDPARMPQDDWRLADTDILAQLTADHTAYADWYQAKLGVDPALNTITARDAAHVLLGPQPKDPMVYRALASSPTYFMQADHMFTGDKASRDASSRRLHDDRLLQAVGGNLADFDPAPLERTTQ